MSTEEMVKKLPENLQKEVMEFVHFLLEKRSKKKGVKLSQDWAGALKEFRGRYTSMDLQHMISNFRI